VPELPDIELYLFSLRRVVLGHRLTRVLIKGPFLLRTFDPPPDEAVGRRLEAVARIGKRIVLDFGEETFFVVHLMIAGRLRWVEKHNVPVPAKVGLAAFSFDNGTLLLVESSTQKRASLHVVQGRANLRQFDRGGLDIATSGLAEIHERLVTSGRTLKRALTDPQVIDGIGNAYSDEILHAARLSPFKRTRDLSREETARLVESATALLRRYTQRLEEEFATTFPGPGDVTAFRPDFAVHGRFGKPCPVCGTAVQRVRFAENEMNYCPRCQTGGRVLADRSLSRLLRDDWPKTIEELEG
jgi:formamidopyrimidine-DNA glycosylase